MQSKKFSCKICGFIYSSKAWAEKCEAWCKKNNSCSLEITRHGKPPKG